MCQDPQFRICVSLITETSLQWHQVLAMSPMLRDGIMLSIKLNKGAIVDWKKGTMRWPTAEEQEAIWKKQRNGEKIR